MNSGHMGLHTAVTVELGGEKVLVDEGIVQLVLWLNELSGVETYTSCEGDLECCSPDAFVGLKCENPESVKRIQDFVRGYAELIHQADDDYRLSFPDPDDLPLFNQERFPG